MKDEVVEITPELIKQVAEKLNARDHETPEQRVKRVMFEAKLHDIELKMQKYVLFDDEPVTLKEYREAYKKAYQEVYGEE